MGVSPPIEPRHRPSGGGSARSSVRMALSGLALGAAIVSCPSAAPAQTGSRADAGVCGLYEAVEPGDTMSAIALRCGVTPETLQARNPSQDPAALRAGAVLSLAPRPASVAPAPDAATLSRFTGLWRGTGADCGGPVGTWHIAADRVLGNGTVFDVAAVEATADGVRADLVDAAGRSRRLTFARTGEDTIAVTGAGIATDLSVCAPPRHLPEGAYRDDPGPVHAPIETPTFRFREAARGDWAAAGRSCSGEVGTWSVRPDVVRGNATRFDVTGLRDAGAGGVAVDVTRRRDGARMTLVMVPGGDWQTLAVTGPGIAVDLRRCPR